MNSFHITSVGCDQRLKQDALNILESKYRVSVDCICSPVAQ